MTDAQIIEDIEKGGNKGLAYLYEKMEPMIQKMVRTNSGTTEEAYDVMQEGITIFWDKLTNGNLILSCKITTYIYSVCWNIWRSELKQKAKYDKDIEDLDIAVEIDTTVLEQKESVEIIRDCIKELSPAYQEVLNAYLEGLNSKELAERCGYKNSSVAKTARYKAQLQLSEIIKSKYSDIDIKS